MYDNCLARTRTAPTDVAGCASTLTSVRNKARRTARRGATASAGAFLVCAVLVAASASSARAQAFESASVLRKISGQSEKLELTTNSSRILTLEKPIPRVQVNNPELLAVTPLSATQVQISAKKAGVTQVNLWDEEGNIHTVDVMVYGDARELTVALQTQFPHSSIRVYRYSESLVLTGFVDRPDHVGPIMRLAEDYAPKVINNISVGGVQQILLKVKVLEVSRTKLRQLGVDWAFSSGAGDFALSSVSDILRFDEIGNFVTNNSDTFAFGIVDGNDSFFGFLEALQEHRVAKILAEPNLVAVSGRPAQFNVGGEFPVLIPQSLGTSSIEFKPYGTQVDFLPIVLGNGNIRLEVRPRISEIDPARSVELTGFDIPALTVRQVDTAVEMKAGQTFALAGLVQERTESVNRGLPYLADLPVIGVPFRRMENEVNEIELLILVTPEFVDPMDACDVQCGGLGYATTSPTNHDLYCNGYVEVPACRNPHIGPYICDGCGPNGCNTGGNGMNFRGMPMITDGVTMPGGVGYDDGSTTVTDQQMPPEPMPGEPLPAQPDDLPLPADQQPNGGEAVEPMAPDAAGYFGAGGASYADQTPGPQYTAPRPYSPPRQPVFTRNTSSPNNPQPATTPVAAEAGESGLIGPVGYDPE
ncbi:MAG TPA: pilus assembly protein N-terminal domain-containing protein [Lacipirellulaceae bacterium]|nr:pilus assembly protein N-terminal domain-containing protein [Lacipirellulaceae bacterium]